jgi:hypothetical protein
LIVTAFCVGVVGDSVAFLGSRERASERLTNMG